MLRLASHGSVWYGMVKREKALEGVHRVLSIYQYITSYTARIDSSG